MMPVTTRDNRDSGRSATPVDDVDLITIVQALPPGDTRREAAYEELIDRYQPTVHGCALRYALNHEMAEDLIRLVTSA
jgi:hypothetical protein